MRQATLEPKPSQRLLSHRVNDYDIVPHKVKIRDYGRKNSDPLRVGSVSNRQRIDNTLLEMEAAQKRIAKERAELLEQGDQSLIMTYGRRLDAQISQNEGFLVGYAKRWKTEMDDKVPPLPFNALIVSEEFARRYLEVVKPFNRSEFTQLRQWSGGPIGLKNESDIAKTVICDEMDLADIVFNLTHGREFLTPLVFTDGGSGGSGGAGENESLSGSSDSPVTPPVVMPVADQVPMRDRVADLSDEEQKIIAEVSTFKTHGVPSEEALRFIKETPEGQQLFDLAMNFAGPDADVDVVLNRAAGFVETGAEVPKLKVVKEPIVKIVPAGKGVSPYSPFFATKSDLDAAKASGKPLADIFGLPVSSDAAEYDVYEMEPAGEQATVFESVVAPTSELGGKFTTDGGATQIVVPDRSKFKKPKKVGTMPNN